MQASAFTVYCLRCDVLTGPEVVENKNQQYSKNYAEMQEDCSRQPHGTAKRVTVNDPMQQHAY
jgi:hypothetical protein